MITGENVIFVQASRPMSLNAFQSKAKRYLQVLDEERLALFDTYSLFEEGKNVWPDQCKRAVTLIDDIGEVVQNFYALLENPLQLPETIVPHRYLLLIVLQHVDEQVRALRPLLNRFRGLCQTASKQTITLQQEIQRRFELLVQGYNDTTMNVKSLHDQARFQGRRIEAAS